MALSDKKELVPSHSLNRELGTAVALSTLLALMLLIYCGYMVDRWSAIEVTVTLETVFPFLLILTQRPRSGSAALAKDRVSGTQTQDFV